MAKIETGNSWAGWEDPDTSATSKQNLIPRQVSLNIQKSASHSSLHTQEVQLQFILTSFHTQISYTALNLQHSLYNCLQLCAKVLTPQDKLHIVDLLKEKK